jgi:hypothetical protein
MGVDRETSGWVDEIFADTVALLHERVEVVARRMNGYPARMISGVRTVHRTNKLKRRVVFATTAMDPELIGAQVGGVKILLLGVKDHSVDSRVGLVRVVLDIFLQSFCGRVGGEDSAVTSVVVEGVAVDGVWRFGCCEEEDGACICRGEGSVG